MPLYNLKEIEDQDGNVVNIIVEDVNGNLIADLSKNAGEKVYEAYMEGDFILAKAERTDFSILFSKEGNFIAPEIVEIVSDYSNRGFVIALAKQTEEQEYCVFDLNGNLIIEPSDKFINYLENHNLFFINNYEFGTHNQQGKIVENSGELYEFNGDFIGYVIEKDNYEGKAENNQLIIELNGKRGILVKGEINLEAIYDDIILLSEFPDLALIKNEGKWHFYNLFEKTISKTSFDEIPEADEIGTNINYYKFIERNGDNGNYEMISNKLAFIIRQNEKYGIALSNGELLVPCIFRKLDFSYGFKDESGADKIVGQLADDSYFFGVIHSFSDPESIFMANHPSLNYNFCQLINIENEKIVVTIQGNNVYLSFEKHQNEEPTCIYFLWEQAKQVKSLTKNVVQAKIDVVFKGNVYTLELIYYKTYERRYANYYVACDINKI